MPASEVEDGLVPAGLRAGQPGPALEGGRLGIAGAVDGQLAVAGRVEGEGQLPDLPGTTQVEDQTDADLHHLAGRQRCEREHTASTEDDMSVPCPPLWSVRSG